LNTKKQELFALLNLTAQLNKEKSDGTWYSAMYTATQEFLDRQHIDWDPHSLIQEFLTSEEYK